MKPKRVSIRTWAAVESGPIKRPKAKPLKTGEYLKAFAMIYDDRHPPKPLTYSLGGLLR